MTRANAMLNMVAVTCAPADASTGPTHQRENGTVFVKPFGPSVARRQTGFLVVGGVSWWRTIMALGKN